ncbi:MAG TPA: hypothetical protein VL048_03725 [Xanthobacteraceae bacterium]|nr:hypothetical protein [Xanthobacteraceae bacterium]
MAEPTQFTFAWKEVAEALIKKADIHEGLWLVSVDFNFTAGVMGPNPGDARPGAAMLIPSLSLVKASAEAPAHLTVDAAKANPAS